MKKVSVIIPVYGVEKYIGDAVRSVLAQTYKNFELIIVDNDSPDRSIEICQQFEDSRIKIIRQKNRGPSGSRNTGIRHAQGDYIAFLDGDDIWLPDKLEKHVTHLDSSPSVGVSFCPSAFIDENGKPLGIYMTSNLTGITPPYIFCRNPVGNGSVGLFRREIFAEIKFQDNLHGTVEDFYFDETFRNLEDVECWLRMAVLTKWQWEGIPEVLTLYRVNTQGSSANVSQQLKSLEQLFEKARSYAPEFIAQWEKPYRGYQLRFLARRLVTLGHGLEAVKLMHRALAANWRLLLEEPRRTLITLAAAYSRWLLPQPLYHWMESLGIKLMGAIQKSRLQVAANPTPASTASL